MLEVRGISKSYGLNTAIEDISFSVDKGEIVGLIGRNGAGKSTTMNIISGYISSDEGSVTIAGHDILKEPVDAKKHLGYMPEFPPLYTDMSVRKYLEFVCRLMGVARADEAEHLDGIIARTGLKEVSGRLIGNLSKGYKQRVGIAKALCGDPEIIMLDEPTSGLDPRQIVDVRSMIHELGKDHAVIISSHILKELSDICTRLVIISGGHIVADDTLENLVRLSGSGRHVRLTVKGGGDIGLSGIDGVISFDKKEEDGLATYDITADGKKDVLEAISRAASVAGAVIMTLKTVEYSLEDVFLELTEGAMEDAK